MVNSTQMLMLSANNSGSSSLLTLVPRGSSLVGVSTVSNAKLEAMARGPLIPSHLLAVVFLMFLQQIRYRFVFKTQG